MAKSKHVKLGEKASMFYDPTTKLKVVPGKAVELSNDNIRSKRVIRAIKSGHLDYADSEDMEDLDVIALEKAPTKKANLKRLKMRRMRMKNRLLRNP